MATDHIKFDMGASPFPPSARNCHVPEGIVNRVKRLKREKVMKWDGRFLAMVELVGTWSKDPSTKVGAVIVRPDKTVASIGYNGFPRGMSDADELYAARETKYSRIVHGEMNAILNAHGSVAGTTLYVPMLCCDRCAVHVIQAGIKRVVCREPSEDMKSRWQTAFETTRAMFSEAGVEVVEYPLTVEVPVDQPPPSPVASFWTDIPSPGGMITGGRFDIDMELLYLRGLPNTPEARTALAKAVLEAAENAVNSFKLTDR